jgi:hypothetical protein
MKQVVTLGLACLALGCAPAEPIESSAEAQADVAEALAGRIAGPPVQCVELRDLRGNRSLDDDSILFEGRGDTVYVNRPPGGCASLRNGRALRTMTNMSRLCRGDIVTVFDTLSGTEYAGCGLGEFVPYRRSR